MASSIIQTTPILSQSVSVVDTVLPTSSQSTSVTSSAVVSPEIRKTFDVTMTITNRDYNSSLRDKESEAFKQFANEVRQEVKNALVKSKIKGFVDAEVNAFSEANSVKCQLTVFVLKTSLVTDEMIREALRDSLGNLTITGVTVVDREGSTTMAPRTTIPPKEGIVFKVTVKIANVEYSEELSDPSSMLFKTLSKNLTDILTKVFKNMQGFLSVEVISFREGSIICIFKVYISEEKSEGSDKKIKLVLTKATKNGETGNYTFQDIEVEQIHVTGKKTGKKETWPVWVIAVISVCGVMLLLTLLMIYLVRMINGLCL